MLKSSPKKSKGNNEYNWIFGDISFFKMGSSKLINSTNMCCSAQGIYDVIRDVLSKLFHMVKTFQKIVFSNMKHPQA
jgi:hypothetical protein